MGEALMIAHSCSDVKGRTMDDTGEALRFDSQAAFAQWLAEHHGRSDGVFLLHAKKGKGETTVTYDEALEVALCFGWIDGMRKGVNEQFFKQRWTPRRARKDGRWDAAYDSVSKSEVPPDLQAALDARPGAADFFATVSSQNRYAVLFRIQTAKKPATRARRIAQFADMLMRGETVY
jgi:uncharacterized protein YdeI (YjbR/CyaY-like superfamily)